MRNMYFAGNKFRFAVNFLHKLPTDETQIFAISEGKANLVTECGRPQGSETSRGRHLFEKLLTNGGEVVSCTSRPVLTCQEDSCCSFLLEALLPQRHKAEGEIRGIKKI
jgi:hypothetical protein